ncbi:transcription factor [Irpex rosettiformis]|uniref:Transcription factor n=1 Tax=Irpex rosettiformis TaxID=378272 RepID=A0ACB8ULB5_9APHY|nr:transcription factor [Irpex rosettiformis]
MPATEAVHRILHPQVGKGIIPGPDYPPEEPDGYGPNKDLYGPPMMLLPRTATKRKLDTADISEVNTKIRRVVRDHVSQNPARLKPMTTVLCLHAAVAQKSYGTEKRFLCPPPIVHIEGPLWNMKQQQLSMAVVSESGERSLEQRAPVDHNLSANFKFLHVTGSAKSKSFQLSLEISDPPPQPTDGTDPGPGRVWATFDSAPVTIISKPSKKTAKTRNITSCILAGGPVSLFNRINSQTVRTKYMTVDGGLICASNTSWSAFTVNVIRSSQGDPPAIGPQPVTYGSEIMLVDQATGTQSGPLQIRKVDKSRVAPDDGGPVSQMQKIALLRVNPDGSHQYLSAAGPLPGSTVAVPPAPGLPNNGGAHQLLYQTARVREEVKDSNRIVIDEVDDYLCWTIVGISKFQYTFFDAFGQHINVPDIPITPFPTLFQAPIYKPSTNELELTVANFFYEHPKHGGRTTLDIYIGNLGPLQSTYYVPGWSHDHTNSSPFVQAIGPDGVAREQTVGSGGTTTRPITNSVLFTANGMTHVSVVVKVPEMVELLKAIQDDLEPPTAEEKAGKDHPKKDKSKPNEPVLKPENAAHVAGRSLPLLFVRSHDGIGYHSGRAIACENVFQTMDIAGMAGPGNGAGLNTDWLAAAQAAASVDNGMHGWTLRVI